MTLFAQQVNAIDTPGDVPSGGGSIFAAVGDTVLGGLSAGASAYNKRKREGAIGSTQTDRDDALLRPFYEKAAESQQLVEGGKISVIQHKANLSLLSRDISTVSPHLVDDFHGDMERLQGINIAEENKQRAELTDATDPQSLTLDLVSNALNSDDPNVKSLMAVAAINAQNLPENQRIGYLGQEAAKLAQHRAELSRLAQINDPNGREIGMQRVTQHLTQDLLDLGLPIALQDPDVVAAISGSGQGYTIYQNVESFFDTVEEYYRNEFTSAGIAWDQNDIDKAMSPLRKKQEALGVALGKTREESQKIQSDIGEAALTGLMKDENIAVTDTTRRAVEEYIGWLGTSDKASMSRIADALGGLVDSGKLPALMPIMEWTALLKDTGYDSGAEQPLAQLFDSVEIVDGFRLAINLIDHAEAKKSKDEFVNTRSQSAAAAMTAEVVSKAVVDVPALGTNLDTASLNVVVEKADRLMTTPNDKLPPAQVAAKEKVVNSVLAGRTIALTQLNDSLDRVNGQGTTVVAPPTKGKDGLFSVRFLPESQLAKFMGQFGLEPTPANLGKASARYTAALQEARNGTLRGDVTSLIRPPTQEIAKVQEIQKNIDYLNVLESNIKRWGVNGETSVENLSMADPNAKPQEPQATTVVDTPAGKQEVAQEPTQTEASPVEVDGIIDDILVNEGGYVNDPDDPGGETNYGITIGTAIEEGLDKNGDGVVNSDDMKLLTPEDAKAVYKNTYYYGANIDRLPKEIQANVLDMNVNAGGNSIKILQRLVGATVDGRIGPETIRLVKEKAAEVGGNTLNEMYAKARRDYYIDLATRSKKLRKYAVRNDGGKGGWIKRAEEFLPEDQRLPDEEWDAVVASL